MALKLSSHLLPISLGKTHNKFTRNPPTISLFTSPNLSSLCCPLSPKGGGGGGARFVLKHAVSEEQTQYSTGGFTQTPPSSSSKVVLVVGGTGGVGQLVVASLLSQNIKSRLLLRDPIKAMSLFGTQDEDRLKIFNGDTRNPSDLDPAMFEALVS